MGSVLDGLAKEFAHAQGAIDLVVPDVGGIRGGIRALRREGTWEPGVSGTGVGERVRTCGGLRRRRAAGCVAIDRVEGGCDRAGACESGRVGARADAPDVEDRAGGDLREEAVAGGVVLRAGKGGSKPAADAEERLVIASHAIDVLEADGEPQIGWEEASAGVEWPDVGDAGIDSIERAKGGVRGVRGLVCRLVCGLVHRLRERERTGTRQDHDGHGRDDHGADWARCACGAEGEDGAHRRVTSTTMETTISGLSAGRASNSFPFAVQR